MKAIAVRPSVAGSLRLADLEFPEPREDELEVEMVRVGICGTDREIAAGLYGRPPSGETELVIGHESLGRVLRAPEGSGFRAGDLVVGIVRHPDPVPCRHCSIGEWDMCSNGLYTEHGIVGLHGFARERYSLDPGRAVRVDRRLGELGVLLEPATILAKAWEHVERIGVRAFFRPRSALITGAGPVGLLAAWMGRQRGLDVTVLDRETTGPKPDLVSAIGATYRTDSEALFAKKGTFDVAIECTGADSLFVGTVDAVGAGGIVCLTGVSSGGRKLPVDLGALNRAVVLENAVVFGSVNANRRHYLAAAQSLAAADPDWLSEFITRRVSLSEGAGAFVRKPGSIKDLLVGATL